MKLGVKGFCTSPTTVETRFVRYDFIQSRVIDTLSMVAGKDNYHPWYSPDGKLWLMDTTGSNLRRLTTQNVDYGFGLPFSWSPDGKSIVYTVYHSHDWTYANGVLWIVDTTGIKRQLTFNPN